MTTKAGRTLLDLVHSLDNPDITRTSLSVSVEFLRLSVWDIEAEAATAVRAELAEKVRALSWNFRPTIDNPAVPFHAVLALLDAATEPASKCYLQDADPPCRYHR